MLLYHQIGSAILAASFHVVVGIALSYSAVLVPQLESPDSGIPPVTKFQTSLVASIIVLMVPIGSIIAGFLMDMIGRINTIKAAAFPAILGFVLIATAPNVYFILAGRIFMGIACALGSSPAVVYITEVARADLRGSLISSGPTIASAGMVFTYIGGALLNWRTVAWLGILFTIIPVVFIWIYVPESPVYLVSRGRIEDAAKSLKHLYSRYPQPENTLESLADMHLRLLIRDNEKRIAEKEKNLNHDGSQKSKWAGFKKPTGYKPLTILFFLFFIQQFSGIYITLFFSVTFLQVSFNMIYLEIVYSIFSNQF
jgi:facilitated trehalose transporter